MIKPIPLNEEWLLKFGFNQKEIKSISSTKDESENDKSLEFEFYEERLDLWISSDSLDNAIYFPPTHIKYVHQLQNLYFALTGEELQIKK